VDGQFLRTTLKDWMAATNFSRENVLSLVYVIAERRSTDQQVRRQDDWVSACDYGHWVTTGGYDNLVKVYAGVTTKKDELVVLEGHTGPVTGCRWVAPVSGDEQGAMVTSSLDGTIRSWALDVSGGEAVCMQVMEGHTDAVKSICVAPNSKMVVSGSWDKTVRLWQAPQPDAVAAALGGPPAAKKSRSDKKKEALASVDTPLAAFTGHSQKVEGVAWTDLATIYSASYDHTVRSWDVSTAACTAVLPTGHAALCVDARPDTSVVISGHSDFKVRLWDPRSLEGTRVSASFASHKNMVTVCAWRPDHTNQFLSGSNDGTIKVWDMRAQLPLYTIKAHPSSKTLCAVWARDGEAILSGGTDGVTRLVRSSSSSSATATAE
jgi:ribosome biogenesis protein YTM1